MEKRINGFKVINRGVKPDNEEEKERIKRKVAYDLFKVLSKFDEEEVKKEYIGNS